MALGIGVVGVGKIAVDQHLPVIAQDPALRLVATVDPRGGSAGVPIYATVEEMLAAEPEVQAVAVCTPPGARRDVAAAALASGRHVLLEKPPGAGLAEVELLRQAAEGVGLTLFAAWHSRFAAGVEAARARLASRSVKAVMITWREDVRRWHPRQDWVWEPGGLGVLDSGINALSIAGRILPNPFALHGGVLSVPQNRQMPIAADLEFRTTDGACVKAALDWREAGDQVWTIAVDTDRGPLVLANGGARLTDEGAEIFLVGADDPLHEYRGVYRHFGKLVDAGASEVNLDPLRHAADALTAARRQTSAPFIW